MLESDDLNIFAPEILKKSNSRKRDITAECATARKSTLSEMLKNHNPKSKQTS